MNSLLVLLAVLGGLALVLRLARSAIRFVFSAAESAAASGLAEASVRRGDLTGLAERQQAERSARRGRRRHGVLALLWFALLVVPPIVGWAPEVYAAAAILWFVPSTRIAPRLPRR